MTLKTDIDAARAAIAKVPAKWHYAIGLEQAFATKYPVPFVLIALLFGITLGVMLVGAFVLVLGLDWGLWVFVAWLLLLILAVILVKAGLRPKAQAAN